MADENQLIAAIERHEALAETYGNLSEDRTKALDYYLGNPMGNEVDGRSQVVSRDVWDTVEWIKPQLADIFCGGDEVVNFTPRGPEDVQGAEQETDFVNYVITQKNPWFSVWYAWSHDALLQKTGYVKAYWDDAEDRTKERYEGLTEEEAAILLQDQGIQVVEHQEIHGGPMPLHSFTIERANYRGCVKLENIAPEHIYIDHNARGLDLQNVAFVEQREYKTITQLRDEGFDVEDDINDGGDGVGDWEEDLRDEYSPFRDREGEESDPTMRRVKVRECWIRFDQDDDGRAELRHVILVGTTILLNEEADIVPIVAMCPTPLPHQHYGLSVADAVFDLQQIKTALLRGSLDNLYLANNGRHVIDEDAINLDDMLVSRPGGVVRKKAGVSMVDAIMPLNHSTTGDIAVPMMEYMDRIAQKRTGVNEQSQGLDPNTLNKTATGAQMLMTAAMQRIRFIARIFAETGVKSLFQVVHALTLKHSRQEEIIRIRNQWVPVDPRQWVKRADMQISVALGAGDKAQQMAMLMQILQMQQHGIQVGVTDPTKIFNALKRLTNAAGFRDANEFWVDPSTQPPAPPQPDPEVLKEQAKTQAMLQAEQMKGQVAIQTAQMQGQIKLQEIQANLELQASNDARDAQREQEKAILQAQLEQQRIQFEEWKTQMQEEMKRLINQTDNATKLQIAEMQTAVQVRSQDSAAMQQDKQMDREDQRADVEGKAKQAESSTKGLESLAKTMQDIAKAQAQIFEAQASLEKAIRAPKKIVRDANGKISGAVVQE